MAYFTHLLKLNELQINGETVDDNDDFNVVDDTEGADAEAEAPADAADNAAEDAGEDIQDQQPADDTATDDDLEDDDDDDFTIADGDDTAMDGTTDETPTDDGGEQPAEGGDAAADDGDDDFTVDGGDAGGEGEDQPAEGEDGGENEGQQQNAAPAKKETPEDPTDGISDDDQRASEEAIYATLTDEQKRIRVLQLKIDFKDLYETIITTMEGINNIPKNEDNLETIKRLNTFLSKAKDILIDYVENNFDSNSYLENYTMYIKYMAVFRTTAKVVEELNKALGKDDNK